MIAIEYSLIASRVYVLCSHPIVYVDIATSFT